MARPQADASYRFSGLTPPDTREPKETRRVNRFSSGLETLDRRRPERTDNLFMIHVRYGALLLLIALPPFTRAATLKSETAAAWDTYLEQARAAMQARLQPGANFLWLEG